MPIYVLHTTEDDRPARVIFVQAITLLHAQTFGTPRAAVRVEVVNAPRQGSEMWSEHYVCAPDITPGELVLNVY